MRSVEIMNSGGVGAPSVIRRILRVVVQGLLQLPNRVRFPRFWANIVHFDHTLTHELEEQKIDNFTPRVTAG
jgi:hypothetical protein